MIWLLAALALAQGILGVHVVIRMATSGRDGRITRSAQAADDTITLVVPVLNEEDRLGGCLDGAMAQPEEVRQILVVDGGSTDGTRAVTRAYTERDPRVQLVDASPVPADAAGKAWGLIVGLHVATADWLLVVDADARVDPSLARSLLAHARAREVAAFSVATLQKLEGALQGLVHPALLATLVYRFGRPGGATSNPSRVQANGQCFMAQRAVLVETRAFEAARASLCEDITVARHLARHGVRVGFYESDALVQVSMYGSAGDAWRNWTRSLPMRDHHFGPLQVLGLGEIVLVQALPLPLLTLTAISGAPAWFLVLQAALAATRIGVLFGTSRAYPVRPWTYWLSPILDLPVAWRLTQRTLQRRQRWRGRTYVRQPDGRFRLELDGTGGEP